MVKEKVAEHEIQDRISGGRCYKVADSSKEVRVWVDRHTYSAKELGEALGVSESKAYSYIRLMNSELQSKGFLTVRGKVSRAYANERFFGGLSQEVTNE